MKTGFKGFFVILLKQPFNPPVFLGDKLFDLLFSVTYHFCRRGLHPAGTQAFPNISPQKRAYLISDNPVKHTPGLLSIDKIHIYRSGRFNRFCNRVFCYFIKCYPAFFFFIYIENTRKMPGYCFPFTIGVGSEKNLISFLCFFLQFRNKTAFTSDINIFRFKIITYINS